MQLALVGGDLRQGLLLDAADGRAAGGGGAAGLPVDGGDHPLERLLHETFLSCPEQYVTQFLPRTPRGWR